MARLRPEFIERVDRYVDRICDVAEALPRTRLANIVADQMARSGTSVGSNTAEADEAISRKEFVKCLGIASREQNETRYWLRMVLRRGWLKANRLGNLMTEAEEIAKILATMIRKSRDTSR